MKYFALILLLSFYNQISINISGFHVFSGDVMIILLIPLIFFKYKINKNCFIKYLVIVFAFLFPIFVSLVSVQDYFSFFKNIIQVTIEILFLAFISLIIVKYNNEEYIYRVIIYITTITSFLGIIQYIILLKFGINIFSFISNYAGTMKTWLVGFTRATSLFEHYNAFALALIPGLILSFYFRYYFLMLINLFGIFASGSRTAFMSIILSVIFVSLIKYKFIDKIKIIFLIVAALVLLIGFFYIVNPEIILTRFSFLYGDYSDQSILTRFDLFINAFNITVENNIFSGLGFGNYHYYTHQDTPESSFFLIFSELGILGISIFTMIFLFIMFISSKRNRDFLTISILSFLISFLFQPFIFVRGIANIFWFLVFFSFFIYFKKDGTCQQTK